MLQASSRQLPDEDGEGRKRISNRPCQGVRGSCEPCSLLLATLPRSSLELLLYTRGALPFVHVFFSAREQTVACTSWIPRCSCSLLLVCHRPCFPRPFSQLAIGDLQLPLEFFYLLSLLMNPLLECRDHGILGRTGCLLPHWNLDLSLGQLLRTEMDDALFHVLIGIEPSCGDLGGLGHGVEVDCAPFFEQQGDGLLGALLGVVRFLLGT